MSITKEELIINKHIDELRERMNILQNDRKANAEMNEESKKRNVEEMKRLKEENHDFRSKIAILQRTLVEASDQDEQRHLEGEVDNLRRIYDNLALKTVRLRKTLQEIYDGMKSAEIESEKPQLLDNEFTRKIRGLENKLDTSMIKYNEAQGIKKTYEQIVYRLRDERFGFENQLSLTERQLHAKQRDYDELLLLSNEAFHAKEVAYTELEDHRKDYEDGRKTREKELREKHQIVQLRKQLVEHNQQRESLRQKLIENDKKEKSLALYNTIKEKSALTEKLQIRNKIDIFEEAFRKIKEATGVSNVNEVITKIISQGDSTENLIAQSRENQVKIESLHQQYRKFKVHVEDLKFASSSSGQYRKLLDDQQEQLNTSQLQLDIAQETFESLSRALITLKSGVGHLQDILDPLRVDFTSSVRQAQSQSQQLQTSSSAFLRITGNINDRRNSSSDDNSGSMALVSFDNNNDNSNTARKSDSRMNTSRKITDLTDETVAVALYQTQRMIAHLLSILNPPDENSKSKQLPLITDNNNLQQQQASKPFNGSIASDDEVIQIQSSSVSPSDEHHPLHQNHDTTTSSHPHHHQHHHSPSSTHDDHSTIATNASNFTAHTVGEEGGQGEGDVTGLAITHNANNNNIDSNSIHHNSHTNGLNTNGNNDNNNNNTSLSTTATTAASATAVLAIEEDIQEYMARTKYGGSGSNNNTHHSQVHHQSSSLDDDFSNAHNNSSNINNYNNTNTKNNNGNSNNNNITLNAFGMKVRPSNANNINDDDNEDEEEDTNKNKRIDVKRASAEILRKMEQKQRQEQQLKLKNEQQKSNDNTSPPKSKGKA